MIKRIIVPTDFSENAFNAAKYACRIALNQGYQVHLFHCYNSETSIFDEKLNAKEDVTPLLKGDLVMSAWKDLLQNDYPDVSLTAECRIGLITEVLPKIAIQPDYSLIVISSNGLEKDDSPIFGSTTSQIATVSRIPVIAIPNTIKSKQHKKAAILTNFKDDELDSLQDFIHLVGTPEALDIIHVYQNSDDLATVELNIKNWAAKVQGITPSTPIKTILKPINYSNQEMDTIPEIINATIEKNDYSIVIVTKTRKSFFAKWFSRSISKEVILKLETIIFFDNN